MKSINRALVAAALLWAGGAIAEDQDAGSGLLPRALAHIDDYVTADIAKGVVPGATITIVRHGRSPIGAPGASGIRPTGPR